MVAASPGRHHSAQWPAPPWAPHRVLAAAGVRPKDSMVHEQVDARLGDHCRQLLEKLARLKTDRARPVGPRPPQAQHHGTVRRPLQPFLRNGRPQHIPAQMFQPRPVSRRRTAPSRRATSPSVGVGKGTKRRPPSLSSTNTPCATSVWKWYTRADVEATSATGPNRGPREEWTAKIGGDASRTAPARAGNNGRSTWRRSSRSGRRSTPR